MIDYEILITGERFEVRAICRSRDEECLLMQYIASLDEADQLKLTEALMLLAERGTPSSSSKYRKLKGYNNLHELKEKPHRLLFFFAGKGIAVFTHGFAKRSDRTPQSELERAVNLRIEYDEKFKAS